MFLCMDYNLELGFYCTMWTKDSSEKLMMHMRVAQLRHAHCKNKMGEETRSTWRNTQLYMQYDQIFILIV